MLSKASSVKCKPILPSVASSDQIAYVKKRDSMKVAGWYLISQKLVASLSGAYES